MTSFREFLNKIAETAGLSVPKSFAQLDEVQLAQSFLERLNEYVFQTYDGIGNTTFDGEELQYFSDFHRFWEANSTKILNPKVSERQARTIASCLKDAVLRYGQDILRVTHDTHGLSPKQIAAVRFLSAVQDFRRPAKKDAYERFLDDETQFDPHYVAEQPDDFLKFLGVSSLSQGDKRLDFAKNTAGFLLARGVDAFGIAKLYHNDAAEIRTALVTANNMGYGYKKANMFIRDMAVLGAWPTLANLDQIDVASDINTMKLALRTGLVGTDIPLLSSFLDIFCHQYDTIDLASVGAWRRVWEQWRTMDPATAPESPCLMDFLLYRIGREYCDNRVVEFSCEDGHHFFCFGANRRNCRVCSANKVRRKAVAGKRYLPCQVDSGKLPRQDGKLLLDSENLLYVFDGTCILEGACGPRTAKFKALNPPKSISIKGKTGWTESYSYKGKGGGGMMG